MTRRREIDRHLHALGEIRDILGAMRNMAYFETRRLAHAVVDQEKVVASVRGALAEMFELLPALAAETPDETDHVLIALGSERGFCGDFNRVLAEQLEQEAGRRQTAIIAVGQRLVSRLPQSLKPVVALPGATTAGEAGDVILRLMHALAQWRSTRPQAHLLRPTVLHHNRLGEVERTLLDPMAEEARSAAKATGSPVRIYLPPRTLIETLTEHYLYAVMQQIFQGSLMAENERRRQHMDNALRRIDEQSERLRRQHNRMRQEEITEEIEAITLDVSTPLEVRQPAPRR